MLKKSISVVISLLMILSMVTAGFGTVTAGASTTYTMNVGETQTLYLSTSRTLNSASWVSNSVAVNVTGSFKTATVEVLSYSSLTPIVTCNYYYWETNALTGARHLLPGFESFYISINKPTLTISFTSSNPYVSSSSMYVKYGEAIGSLPTPHANGYTFLGWYTSPSGGTQVTTSSTFTENTTLYARWSQNPVSPTSAPSTTAPTATTTAEPEIPIEYSLIYQVLDDGTAEIVDYIGADSVISIPSTLDGFTVTGIGYAAFKDNDTLTGVTLPNTITYIGEEAFYDCDALTYINFPSGLTAVGEKCFYSCDSLRSVSLPATVTALGSRAFFRCTSLTSAVLRCGCDIGDYAFCDCNSLKTLVLSNGVTGIGSFAFYGCENLGKVTMPDSVTSMGSGAFMNCTGLTEIQISDSVTSIGISVFKGCSSLTKVNIPDSVTSIGDELFSGCSRLRDIDIPESVANIKAYAFYGCKNLREITIPRSVTSIERETFYNCTNLLEVNIPDSVTEIKTNAFLNCYLLEEVIIPSSVTSIGEHALGYFRDYFSSYTYSKDSNFTIYGYEGTEAERYANDNEISFVALEVEPHTHTSAEAVRENVKEATCTAEGSYDEVVYCAVCGEEISRSTKTIAKTAHTLTYVEEVAATTAKTGTKAHYQCSVCGKLFADGTGATEVTAADLVIPKLIQPTEGQPTEPVQQPTESPDMTVVTVTAPDGSAESKTYRVGDTFTVCLYMNASAITNGQLSAIQGMQIHENDILHPEDVEDGAEQVTDIDAMFPFSKSSGAVFIIDMGDLQGISFAFSTGSSFDFSSNTQLMVVNYKVTSAGETEIATGLSQVNDINMNTVFKNGTYTNSKDEGKLKFAVTLSGGQADDPHTHTPAEAVRENVKEATCTAEGSYDEVVYCSVCGEEISRTTKTIAKTAHTLTYVQEVAATTAKTGTKAHYQCSVCGKLFADGAGATEVTAADLVIPKLETEVILGDVDGDGSPTITDATWIQCELAHMSVPGTYNKTAADVDGDDDVTIIDATWIQRYLAYMDTPYAIGETME